MSVRMMFSIAVLSACAGWAQENSILTSPTAWRASSNDLGIAATGAFSDAELKAFVLSVMKSSGKFAEFLADHDSEDIVLGSHVIKDLNQDGTLELIISYDVIGRPIFRSFLVIAPDVVGFHVAAGAGLPEDQMEASIRDLDGDGRLELITVDGCPAFPNPLSALAAENLQEPEVAPCQTTSVLSWNGKELIDESPKQWKFYLHEVLPAIQKSIQAIHATFASESAREVASSYYLSAQFQSEQKLGYRNAGLEKALEWADRPEPELRLNALRVLSGVESNMKVRSVELRLKVAMERTLLRNSRVPSPKY